MLMFAYGSNLNKNQMKLRAPDAVPLGKLCLPDNRLIFRGVADCQPELGAECWGGVWRISAKDEAALDTYEGVANGLYRKDYIPIKPMPDGERFMLIYRMYSHGIFPPSEAYLGAILQGYEDFALGEKPIAALHRAVAHSWERKAPTHRERARHKRKGRPPLAGRPAGYSGPAIEPIVRGKQLELLPAELAAPKAPLPKSKKARKKLAEHLNPSPMKGKATNLLRPNGADRFWNPTLKQWES